jgi:hypothetical protein
MCKSYFFLLPNNRTELRAIAYRAKVFITRILAKKRLTTVNFVTKVYFYRPLALAGVVSAIAILVEPEKAEK